MPIDFYAPAKFIQGTFPTPSLDVYSRGLADFLRNQQFQQQEQRLEAKQKQDMKLTEENIKQNRIDNLSRMSSQIDGKLVQILFPHAQSGANMLGALEGGVPPFPQMSGLSGEALKLYSMLYKQKEAIDNEIFKTQGIKMPKMEAETTAAKAPEIKRFSLADAMKETASMEAPKTAPKAQRKPPVTGYEGAVTPEQINTMAGQQNPALANPSITPSLDMLQYESMSKARASDRAKQEHVTSDLLRRQKQYDEATLGHMIPENIRKFYRPTK